MKDHSARGSFGLHIFGDWQTVMDTARAIERETANTIKPPTGIYDDLLRQMPSSEEDENYFRYTLHADKAADLFALFERFRKAKLEVEIFCQVDSGIGASAFAATGSGWSAKPSPVYGIEVDTAKISPKGYRLIDTAKEPFRKDAIWWREGRKDWQPVRGDEYDEALLYCVPIDPPKPAYRPFRGGKEFEPFEDEWTIHIQQKVKFPPQPYSDNHWSGGTWEKAFELYTFADGRPFGMPVND